MKPVPSFDPFKELSDLQKRLSSLFLQNRDGETALAESSNRADWAPAVDVAESDSEYTITADLPEVKKEDVSISIEGGILTFSGERSHESEEKDPKKKFHRIERSYGSYARSFQVPSNVDASAIRARFEDGVLRIHLPKQAVSSPSRVDVSIS
ncbi:MAG TPA: Hsp20/alpha crystallin family protein [Verrucomicrobiales bacterium]|nr:Hsp20/alpha crystallin family protein [Verrucomicrobiales bacterium]